MEIVFDDKILVYSDINKCGNSINNVNIGRRLVDSFDNNEKAFHSFYFINS
ncbi:MAG: hypothetical protein LBV42_01310 [Methanobrevibacter sp.]|jgi:hypothetical protein|nr:hypothetical protein [Methanobrevibacter sp.]